jgi:hypothetical protein
LALPYFLITEPDPVK